MFYFVERPARQSSCAFEWALHGFAQSDRETDLLIAGRPSGHQLSTATGDGKTMVKPWENIEKTMEITMLSM